MLSNLNSHKHVLLYNKKLIVQTSRELNLQKMVYSTQCASTDNILQILDYSMWKIKTMQLFRERISPFQKFFKL